ncbi:MAG TPA: amidohydrolase family protein, partial [Bryobacteraceae bacterium]|nr:amidohydrolase family protein [Bryobacteraceae bacterium]
RPDRPWPPARNEPHTPAGWSAEQMFAEMDAARVDRAVIVPPTWVGENNLTAIEAATAHPTRFAVMGRFDVDAPDAEQKLATWLQQPGMLGIRMTFGFKPKTEAIDDGSLDWYWAACERNHIPLMLNLPAMAEKAGPIAQRYPDLTIVIDHMGLAHGAGSTQTDEQSRVLALAQDPKVHIKVSCVPNYSAEPYPHHDIQPYLRRLYETFGPRRLFWGADITRLQGSYTDCVQLFREGLDFLSVEDRDWILGRGLAEALNWPEA